MVSKFLYFLKRGIKFILPHGIVKIIKYLKIKYYLFKNPKIEALEYKNKNIYKKNIFCVFAFYSHDGLISSGDIYYIKQLSKISNVLVIGDCGIFKKEIRKIKKYVTYAKFERHEKYDFGSYYIGFKYLLDSKMFKSDDLLLVNNSCFGPIFDLNHIISLMNDKNIDFWGLNSSFDHCYHIQSYFYYFKNSIISDGYLEKFLKKVKKENSKFDVINNYELKLTRYLKDKGYKCDSYVPLHTKYFDRLSKTKHIRNKMSCPYYLVKHFKFPLIKKKIFINRYDFSCYEDLNKLFKIVEKSNPEIIKVIKEEFDIKKIDKNIT